MRPRLQRLARALAAHAGEADAAMDVGRRVSNDSPASASAARQAVSTDAMACVDAEARRGRPGDAGAEHGAVGVLDARAAARAAAVDADEERSLAGFDHHGRLPPDARAAAHELAVERLVAAVEVVDAVDHRLAFRRRGPARTRLTEARRSVAITGAPLQPLHPAHQRRGALQRRRSRRAGRAPARA